MFRLHLESSKKRNPLFHLTEDAWNLASKRHPELSSKIDVSIGWDEDILAKSLNDAQGIIVGPLNKELIANAPKLEWIHTTGAGVDHLFPIDWLPARIPVTNSSGIHADKTEDFISMSLLMLHNRIPQIIADQAKRQWKAPYQFNIKNKTVAVLGFGDLGQAAGRGAKRLNMNVIAITRTGKPQLTADKTVAVEDLDSILSTVDFLVVATPLTAQTKNLIDKRRLALLPPGSGVINIGRAAVIDNEALKQSLIDQHLSGAILDVFELEPIPEDAGIWAVPNLVITPHISCDSPDYIQRVLDLWFENFANLLHKKKFKNIVNRNLGY
jgi:phosphoglycerate dehydrogenase-like enzyme